jgi:hypothetical protein
MSSLNRDQLRILSAADDILDDIYVDLCLAETDEDFNMLRDGAIRMLTELGEPEVFEDYKEMWDAAAAIIVPIVNEAQISNGVQPYTPAQYANHGAGTEGEP